MAFPDIIIIAIIGISLFIGLLRGVVHEMLSLAAWIAALWAGYRYAALGGVYLETYIADPPLRAVVALVVIFVVVLIVASLLGRLIRHLLPLRGAGGLDRTLGMLFGIARGAAIISLALMAADFLELTDHSWWDDSMLSEYFDPIADFLRALMPADLSAYFQPPIEPV